MSLVDARQSRFSAFDLSTSLMLHRFLQVVLPNFLIMIRPTLIVVKRRNGDIDRKVSKIPADRWIFVTDRSTRRIDRNIGRSADRRTVLLETKMTWIDSLSPQDIQPYVLEQGKHSVRLRNREFTRRISTRASICRTSLGVPPDLFKRSCPSAQGVTSAFLVVTELLTR